MAKPTTREQLKEHCLRALGAPVIEINIDEDQCEDRLDDAIQFYQEFHSDAVIRTYLNHQLTANDITNNYIHLFLENTVWYARSSSSNVVFGHVGGELAGIQIFH